MELPPVIILCLLVWLMLLPCVSVVDVINHQLMHCFGRCYCQVADGKATAGWLCYGRCYCQWQMEKPQVNYFNFSSEVLSRTSSQTCGRWYFPTFLFRDGSLTLMYRASFIVLIRFKSSLPTMLKLLMVTLWPVKLLLSYMGEGGFRYSLNLSPKVLDDSPIYSSSHFTLSHWYL